MKIKISIALFLILLLLTVLHILGEEISTSWQDWNYYQMLGLQPEDYYYKNGQWSIKSRRERTKERRQIQLKDIKKAYRTQAQAWHPDKIVSRKQQQIHSNNSTKTSASNIPIPDYSNVSIEDCNARFAKIAEAYEILTDEEKRREYDEFLLQTEDSMQNEYKRQHQRDYLGANRASTSSSYNTSYDSSVKGGGDMYQNKFTDSFFDAAAIFENFFFGTQGDNSHGHESYKNRVEDIFDSFFSSKASKQYNHRQPDRMSETTQIRYDPRYGKQIVKVLQREEFDEPNRNRIYYRVIAQEFLEEVDFYGRTIGYSPISDPIVVDEGEVPLRRNGSDEQNGNNHGRSSFSSSDYRRKIMKQKSHRMERNEYLTPRSAELRSTNQEYYARLTSDCELVIMHDEGEFREDSLVWTSGTYVPPQHRRKGCTLAMYGPRIAIVVGDIDDPTTVLWSSPSPPPIVPGSSTEGEEVIDYYCSLDNDGSIAVYRTRKKMDLSVNGSDLWSIAQMWWSDLIGDEDNGPPRTNAVAKWKSIQRWAILKTKGRPSIRKSSQRKNKSFHENNDNIDECVFATGIAGCLSPGRYVVQISKHVKRSLEKAVMQLDDKVGDFVDSLTDGRYDDYDLVDTFLRIINKAGTSLGDQVQALTLQGIRFAKEVMNRLDKWMKIVQYEVIDFFHRSRVVFFDTMNFLKRTVEEKYDEVASSWEL